ncbi:hypothetical protein CRG98_007903 [Punica granatum]|nr:hypothetical protein CRG98_007903 [Punica granatum]
MELEVVGPPALNLDRPPASSSSSEDFLDGPASSSFSGGLGLSCSDPSLDPHEGMEFDSEQAARVFYNSYARRLGFSIRASTYQRSKKDGSIICRQIVCHREGFRRRGKGNTKPKRQRADTRVGCKAQMMVKKHDTGRWVISRLVKEHNHELVPPDKVHCLRSHRHVSGPARSLIDTLQAAGMGASGVMSVLIRESGGINNVGFTKIDCQNYMSGSNWQKSLGKGLKTVFDYFQRMQEEDPGFFYAVEGDSELSGGNIFWADSNAIKNYTYFGDTVIFDSTYRTDRYRVPFAPFTGWNHHGQPVLFGCALILNESESSFIWLFESWAKAMSGHTPPSITTDHDRIIRAAVSHVFSGARHRFCTWTVLREVHERLSDAFCSHPTLEVEFQKCVNGTETVDEFEFCWDSLLKRYDLENNQWLQSMYDARQHWIPAYLRDTFFGEALVTQRSDCAINSYFDGYINASTSIHVLIEQYEKAVASRYEKELKSDQETLNVPPVLKTPSPMEKQASNIYTRNIFKKFQEELVDILAYPATLIKDSGSESTYRVEKFGEEDRPYSVKFDVLEKKALCSCQMFEFSGIICKHILAVFRVTNTLTLPSHYFLRRWTRHARSSPLLDEKALGMPCNSLHSAAARFENLCREAIKYVQEGAESVETYKVAREALHLAAEKVAAAKKNDLGLASNQKENEHPSQSCSTDQDKRIQQLTSELETANKICEAYRKKLLDMVKDMEEQKLKILVKVQSMKLNLRRLSGAKS